MSQSGERPMQSREYGSVGTEEWKTFTGEQVAKESRKGSLQASKAQHYGIVDGELRGSVPENVYTPIASGERKPRDQLPDT